MITYYSQNDKKTASELIQKIYSKSRIYKALSSILIKNHFKELLSIVIQAPLTMIINGLFLIFGILENKFKSDSEHFSYLIIHGRSDFHLQKDSLVTKNQNIESIIVI